MEVITYVDHKRHSIGEASRTFGMSRKLIRTWVTWNRANGPSIVCTKWRKYPPEFKRSVLEYMRATGQSSSEVATHFEITSPGLILNWKHAYEMDGFSGLLPKPKGRKPKAMSDKPNKSGKPRKPKVPEREPTREELLAKENEQLRMEVAYLKKLQALVQQREESERKTR